MPQEKKFQNYNQLWDGRINVSKKRLVLSKRLWRQIVALTIFPARCCITGASKNKWVTFLLSVYIIQCVLFSCLFLVDNSLWQKTGEPNRPSLRSRRKTGVREIKGRARAGIERGGKDWGMRSFPFFRAFFFFFFFCSPPPPPCFPSTHAQAKSPIATN